jgi:tripeptide aminopeptidase
MASEEVFGKGAKAYDYDGWGFRSREAYVFDMTGPAGYAAVAAPSIIGWEARIKGKAAHAGFAPETGVNAISAAARAAALLSPGRIGDDTTMADIQRI